jgi:hypothetical protein
MFITGAKEMKLRQLCLSRANTGTRVSGIVVGCHRERWRVDGGGGRGFHLVVASFANVGAV